MRKQSIKTLFFAFILTRFCYSSTEPNKRRFCGTLLATATLKKYSNGNGLRIVPGNNIAYPKGSFFEKNALALNDASLILAKGESLEKIAATLAQGNSAEEKRILGILVSHQKAHGEEPLSLQKVLPPSVSGLTNTNGERASNECGPNCINASLLWHQIVSEKIFQEPDIVPDILNTKFQKLEVKASLKYGDLIVLKTGDQVLHTMIYIDDNIVWHKGSSGTDPWTFETLDSAISFYSFRKGINLSFYRKL